CRTSAGPFISIQTLSMRSVVFPRQLLCVLHVIPKEILFCLSRGRPEPSWPATTAHNRLGNEPEENITLDCRWCAIETNYGPTAAQTRFRRVIFAIWRGPLHSPFIGCVHSNGL